MKQQRQADSKLVPEWHRPGGVHGVADRSAHVVDVRPIYEQPAIQAIHRRRWRVLTAVMVLVDLTAVISALGVATLLVPATGRVQQSPPATWQAAWVAAWWLGLATVGLYDVRRIENVFEELRRIVYGVALGAALSIVASFWIATEPARGWTVAVSACALVFVASGRRVVRKVVHGLRRRGRLRRRALIVGADPSGVALANDVAAAPWEGLDVIGFVAVDGEVGADLNGGAPLVGSAQDLREIAVSLAASDVFVAPSVAGNGRLSSIVSALDGVPVELRVAAGLDGFLTSRLSVQPLGHRALIAIERSELRPVARVAKRAMDIVLGSILLILATPIIAVAAIAVWIESPGSPFFAQPRVGLRGRPFRIWKLRTMCSDAEERRTDLQARNEAGGLLFKIRDDPRITRVGRFLRRSSIDELPQLANVVFGHMSLVGPRPPLPAEVELYDDILGRRLLVRPGITGLWQVSGRNELSLGDYVRFDLLYVQNWSIALDVYILVKTVPAVLSGRGAY